jgi:O-antigen/teichoic acid export membrane protein
MVKKLVTNSFYNVAQPILNLGITFIMTPIIIRAIGNHDYGIWEIVISIVGYMGILKFGINPAIVRFTARYNALNDKENLNVIYSTAFFYLFVVGVISSFILIGWALIAPETLAPDGKEATKYIYFLIVIAFHVIIVFISALFDGLFHGYQNYGITRISTSINALVGSVIIYFLLKGGHGLLAIALVRTVGTALKTTFYWILLRKSRFGGFRFDINNISSECLKDLFSFGFKSFALGITQRISYNTDAIVIGAFLGPGLVPFFIIPANLIIRLNNLINSITVGFMPFFSELHAKGEDKKSLEVYLAFSRYIAGIGTFFFLSILFIGPSFIKIWIGSEFMEKGTIVLYLLTFSYLLRKLHPLTGRLLTSMGRHGILAKIGAIISGTNIILSIIFVNYFGIIGVALGTLVPLILFEPYTLYYSCKNMGLSFYQYVRIVLRPIVLPAILICISYYIILSIIDLENYFNIFAASFYSGFMYLFLFYFLAISNDERKYITTKFKIFVNYTYKKIGIVQSK